MKQLDEMKETSEVRCDFCGQAKEVGFAYPIKNTTSMRLLGQPDSARYRTNTDTWLACVTCKYLTEKRDWDELAERCLDEFSQGESLHTMEQVYEPGSAEMHMVLFTVHQQIVDCINTFRCSVLGPARAI